MARYFLRRLTVEGFRGINNHGHPISIEFDPCKITSVFGRNGLGKSSLFDALTYAIKGEVPRLARMQTTESPDKYYLNTFHDGPAIITLEFTPDDRTRNPVTITVSRDKQGRRRVDGVGTSDPEQFLAEINCETLLLDYLSFNNFLSASPLERGRTFSQLIGLGSISILRKNLQALSDTNNINTDCGLRDLEGRLKQAERQRFEAINTAVRLVREISNHSFAPETFDPSIVEQVCLDALSQNAILKSCVEGKQLSEIDFAECAKRVESAEGAPERSRLQQLMLIQSELESPVSLDRMLLQCNDLRIMIAERDRLLRQSRGQHYKNLYDAALQLIDAGWPEDRCPLCEQAWQHPSRLDLRSFLTEQLGSFQKLIEIEEDMERLWSEIIFEDSLERATAILRRLNVLPDQPPSVQRAREIGVPSQADVDTLEQWIQRVEKAREETLTRVSKEISELEARIPRSLVESVQLLHAAKELRDALEQYHGALQAEEEVRRKIAAVNQWKEFIQEVAREFAAAEAQLLRDMIGLLENDIRTIFADIFSDRDIVPKLHREERQERLHLMLERFFTAEDVHAVPILSESARNALALAIFLAASRRRKYGGRFLVLDDVTSSFDAGHQTLLIDAVRKHIALPEVQDGLQVIFLTHDSLLEKLFDQAVSKGWAWTSLKLKGTPPIGMIFVSRFDDARLTSTINSYLDAGEVEQALPLVRQYLEYRLLEVIREVGIRVPLDFSTKEDRRMVGTMLEAIQEEVQLHRRAGTLILSSEQETQISKFLIPALISNWVNHYSTGAVDAFSPNVVRRVMESIDALVRAFKYRCVCGGQPRERFYRNLTQKHKNCGPNCRPVDFQLSVS